MDPDNKEHQQRAQIPAVPIETYLWEDVRRARLRGGYPWTHLYKDPFDEIISDCQFKIPKMSKSFSTPIIRNKSRNTSVSIQDVTEEYFQSEKSEEPARYVVIPTDLPSDLDNHSKVIVEEQTSDNQEVLNLESAESSDNISQYLDKEEPPPVALETLPIPSKTAEPERERAKSEEPKRKRSIDSSYSRKSLSKLGFLKKLKDASAKIKVPKFLSSSTRSIDAKSEKQEPKYEKLGGKPDKSEAKNDKLPPKPPQPAKDKTKHLAKKDAKPVYIHIPLKPPEGQTDEFSYLEFGEKKPDPPEVKPTAPNTVDEAKEGPSNSDRRCSENPDEIVAIEILKSESIDFGEVAGNGIAVDKGDIYIISPDAQTPDENNDGVFIFMPGSEAPADATTAETVLQLSRSNSTRNNNRSKTSLESDKRRSDGSQSKSRSVSRSSSRKVRSKSAEPEKKRKLSVDSSYSRISMSKLGLMKKLRDARDKIASTLSRKGSSKKSTDDKPEAAKATQVEPSEKKETKIEAKLESVKSSKKSEPKYIHIPLKPPEGQSDEFSYLEFEEKRDEPPVSTPKLADTEEKQSSVESPVSVQNDGVQFIFLTPPSDDEILDQPDTPETPLSAGKPGDIGELKEIAKDAVEEACVAKGKMEAVPEEDKTEVEPKAQEVETKPQEEETRPQEQTEAIEAKTEDQPATEEAKIEETTTKPAETIEQVIVDEEDGLKSTVNEPTKEETVVEVKSSLKTDGSPVLKKKVSFKRRSRDDTKDKEYEEIQAPVADQSNEKDISLEADKPKLEELGVSQSMSVDEEKSYLDKKIIKDTSLEEDYSKWSKLSDHEYEPVNPPENTSQSPVELPSIKDTHQRTEANLHGSISSLERRMLANDDVELTQDEPTAQQFQTHVENRFFSRFKSNKPKEESAKQPKEESVRHTAEEANPPKQESSGRFQKAIRSQAGKLKSQLDRMHKPKTETINKTTTKTKTKVKKPRFSLPKIPDTTTINLPTFSLSRVTKKTVKERQLSTESNASETKPSLFDFKTYPRIFKKKQKEPQNVGKEQEIAEVATFPRTKRKKDEDEKRTGGGSIRIKLHSSSSPEEVPKREFLNPEESILSNGNSSEDQAPSHVKYDMDLDLDEAYEKENREIHRSSPFSSEYNKRWNHGSFHPELNFQETHFRNQQVTDLDSPDDSNAKEIHSSQSSLGVRRQGVLEEIGPDEFFLRQKGISQDNIEVGMYLSSEIRHALNTPSNALADIGSFQSSNQSLNDTPKKKPIKKPKRKKTPHVSHEKLPDDPESDAENELLPPSRPRRRSKKKRFERNPEDDVIPYQETIAVDDWHGNGGVASNGYHEEQGNKDDDVMEDIDADVRAILRKYEEEEDMEIPAPPPRRQRSMKSLNSEQSAQAERFADKTIESTNVDSYKAEFAQIVPDSAEGSLGKSTGQSSLNGSQFLNQSSEDISEPPVRPSRTRSRSGGESLISEPAEPCVEEPCVQDIRDYMGYSVVDKNVKREPPLPPPRTPPRRKKSLPSEQRFFTVPRQGDEQPVRPLRNYSTLGPSRPPRRRPPPNMTDEEKEHIDITQYIEIEEEPKCDLQSGEVIQKMRDRPLPAPPRPPRKARSPEDTSAEQVIDPNADEDVCVLEEARASEHTPLNGEITHVERRLILPSQYSYEEETITTGSLVVQPLDGARILRDSDISRRETPVERIVPITTDLDDEESEIPEHFAKLKNPAEPTDEPKSNVKQEVVTVQKLQVTDLDVERLSVNELLANKIIVSEIESGTIDTQEISSKSGASVKINEIELPPNVIQQLLERFQFVTIPQTSDTAPASGPSTRVEDVEDAGQKKTPIEFDIDEEPPQRPPRRNDDLSTEPSMYDNLEEVRNEDAPPRPPQRHRSQPRVADIDIDEEPPPRPPQPSGDYFPSQPPASFYALRAQHYVDSMETRDIPPPRRRRRKRTVSNSSSSDESLQRRLSRRRHRKSPEPSIPQLTGQLIGACVSASDNALKRLIIYITNNVLRNADGQQDVHVMLVILLTLLAGLILLGFGDGKTLHYHHWEYFNPPRDM